MTWSDIQPVWPLLALLAYALIHCVLTVLATYRRNQIEVHDRVRQSKRLRQEFLMSKGQPFQGA